MHSRKLVLFCAALALACVCLLPVLVSVARAQVADDGGAPTHLRNRAEPTITYAPMYRVQTALSVADIQRLVPVGTPIIREDEGLVAMPDAGLNALKELGVPHRVIAAPAPKETVTAPDKSEGTVEASNPIDINIPDYSGSSPGFTSAWFGVSAAPAEAVVVGVSLRTRIVHTWPGDLVVKLNSNDLAAQTVWNRDGGGDDGGDDDDTATDDDIELEWRWVAGGLVGAPVNGNWYLDCWDYAPDDVGYIDYAHIVIYYQTVAQPVDVDADVENIQINNEVVSFGGSKTVMLDALSEGFTVRLQGENDGPDDNPAGYNSLTLSIETFTSSGDKALVSTVGASSDLDITEYFGAEATGGDAYANYVMVEAVDDNGWLDGESNYMTLKVIPKQWGAMKLHFRMGLGRDESFNNFDYDPSDGLDPGDPDADCLGFDSYVVTVNVENTPAPADISGRVTIGTAPGGCLSGAGVRATGNGAVVTTTTAADGTYRFSNLPAGTYRIEPIDAAGFTAGDYNWSPGYYDITLAGSDVTSRNYSASCRGMPQVSITAPDFYVPGEPFDVHCLLTNTNYSVADAFAYLSLTLLRSFPAVISTQATGFDAEIYQPGAPIFHAPTASEPCGYFMTATYPLVDGSRQGLTFNSTTQAWMTVTITPPVGATGDFALLYHGSLGSRQTPSSGELNEQGFATNRLTIPCRRPGDVAGRVTFSTAPGGCLGGVQVLLQGGEDPQEAFTASDGTYAFADVPPGDYVVAIGTSAEVVRGDYTWSPDSRPVSVDGDVDGIDFTAASRARLDVSISELPTHLVAGETCDFTVRAINVNYASNTVPAYLSVTVPGSVAISVVDHAAGLDVQTYLPGAAIYHAPPSPDACGYDMQAGDKLIDGYRLGVGYDNPDQMWMTLRVTAPTGGLDNLTLRYHATVGGRNEPVSGDENEQGFPVHTAVIPVLADEEIAFGTTVIVHGYSLFSFESGPKSWMLDMGRSIAERCGGRARILTYDKQSGLFVQEPGAPGDATGETVLLFDWATESRLPSTGFSEAAGDALFAALMRAAALPSGDPHHVDLDKLHFIGHSRGCAVQSETVERLLQSGRYVDHVTNLDPHDMGYDVEGQPLAVCTDLDVNTFDVAFPANLPGHPGVVSWEGVGFVDTYWQDPNIGVQITEPDYLAYTLALLAAMETDDPVDDLIENLPPSVLTAYRDLYLRDLGGRPVQGTANLKLPELSDIGHSGVTAWYRATIAASAPAGAGWFESTGNDGDPMPSRWETGFAYSNLGRQFLAGLLEPAPRPDMFAEGPQSTPQHSFGWYEGVNNGDLDHRFWFPWYSGGQLVTWAPGWDFHGGCSAGLAIVSNLVGGIEFDTELGARRACHNSFYVPAEARAIEFAYRFNSLLFFEGTLSLNVLIDGNVIDTLTESYEGGMFEAGSGGWRAVPLSDDLTGRTVSLSFEFDDGGAWLSPTAYIDDIRLVLDQTPSTIPHTPIALSPADSAQVTELPVLTWSAFSDGGDGDDQSGFQVRIRHTESDEIIYDTGFVAGGGNAHAVQPAGTYTGFDAIAGCERVSNEMPLENLYHWHVRFRDSSGDWSAWSADVLGGHQHFKYVSEIVAVQLDGMTVTRQGDQAVIEWVTNYMDDGDQFRLTGRTGPRRWDVPFELVDENHYRALDSLAGLATGEEIVYTLYQRSGAGDWGLLAEEAVIAEVPTVAMGLMGASPNPFNPQTTIRLSVSREQVVSVQIYDVQGRRVAELARQVFPAGVHSLVWDGRHGDGRQAASGTYFVLMRGERDTDRMKIMMLK